MCLDAGKNGRCMDTAAEVVIYFFQIVLNTIPPHPTPPLITRATPMEVVSGFIVQLIVHLSLAPSVWSRVGPSQFNG